jgi:hypothetical protein
MKKRWFLLALFLGVGIYAYFTIPAMKEEKLSYTEVDSRIGFLANSERLKSIKKKGAVLHEYGSLFFNRFSAAFKPAKKPILESTSVYIPKHVKEKIGSYFFPIPISKFTRTDIPCLLLNLNNLSVSAELDLGQKGNLTISKEIIDQIQEKTLLGEKTSRGIQGKIYKAKVYQGPEVKIGSLTFSNCDIYIQNDDFNLDSIILKKGDTPIVREPGRIGWQLFRGVNLFLDLGNSQIAFCDNVKTLTKHGYPTDLFIKTPLLSERGLVEFEAITPNGPLIFSLDTGCTWNLLNTENEDGNSIEELIFNPNNKTQLKLKINDINLGLLQFRHIPIRLPIQIDAMLGMEFFRTHQVFLDFAENQIYIRPLYAPFF